DGYGNSTLYLPARLGLQAVRRLHCSIRLGHTEPQQPLFRVDLPADLLHRASDIWIGGGGTSGLGLWFLSLRDRLRRGARMGRLSQRIAAQHHLLDNTPPATD